MKNLLTTFLVLISVIGFNQNTRYTVNPGNWSNPSTWDTVPNTGDNIVINHSIMIDVKDTVNDITVNQTTFTIDTLFITGVLNLEADIFSNPIVFVNNDIHKGRLGVTSNGQIINNYVWQKWIERCDGWGMYGGPFDVPLSDYGFFHTGFPGTAWPTFWCNTYLYDEAIPNQHQDTGWVKPNHVNDILSKSVGISIFDSTSSPTNNSRVVELVGSTDLTETVIYNITCSGGNNKPENGWNLVSNPYPGTIDWDASGWTKNKISDAIWVWDNCNDIYAAYVGGIGVNGGIPYVSSGQAFWIKAEKGGPTLTSTRDVIVDTNQELKSTNSNDGLVRISLNGDEIVVCLNGSSTNQYDSLYDAYKFLSTKSYLYTNLDTINYSINSILDEDTIPLYVRGDGMLDFDISELSVIPTMYYEDLQTGMLYDMSVNQQYSFTSTNNGYYHRFNLIIPQSPTSVEELNDVNKGTIIKRLNIMGQEVNEYYKGVIIELYSNGRVRKIVNN